MVKVVFCLYGNELFDCARIMVDSCKRFGHTVWQLSDLNAPEIFGVDRVIRKPIERHALFRFRHLANLDPPYLSMDVDAFMAKDAGAIEDPEFDAVLTVRESPEGMPYNSGVFWVNNQQFIKDCLSAAEGMSVEKQNWFADQFALAEVAPKYKIKELPCSTWNYSPDFSSQFGKDVFVYHFKGKRRKPMMKEFYERQSVR